MEERFPGGGSQSGWWCPSCGLKTPNRGNDKARALSDVSTLCRFPKPDPNKVVVSKADLLQLQLANALRYSKPGQAEGLLADIIATAEPVPAPRSEA